VKVLLCVKIFFMEDIVKREFVKRELSRYARRVNELFLSSINKMNLIDESDLMNNIRWRFYKEEGDGGVQFSFPAHGRFQDMGAGRGYKLGVRIVEDVRTNGNVYKKRKPKKWYTKNVYRGLGGLYSGLMYGFTEEIKANIKKDILKDLDDVKKLI